jgi:hypothetical protein
MPLSQTPSLSDSQEKEVTFGTFEKRKAGKALESQLV